MAKKQKKKSVCPWMLLLALVCLSAGATGGFRAGSYVTGQKMQKSAIAHSCGVIDPETLEFSWMGQSSIGMVIDSMPDVGSKKKKGSKK